VRIGSPLPEPTCLIGQPPSLAERGSAWFLLFADDLDMLGTPYLKSAYGDALERALRATVPGMADYADLDSTSACGSCCYWQRKPKSERLGVEPQHVVLGQSEATDGRLGV
jgi:hypothetical protein